MNLTETAKLLTMIQSLYPNQMKSGEDFNMELTTKLWQKLFKETTFHECVNALMQYASLNKFMPHPSDLKEFVAKSQNPEAYKPPEEAWEEVCSAIKRFGYYNQDKAYASFDKKLKRVVKMIGWSTLCHSERVDLVRRNFFELWKNTNVQEQETLKLPTFNQLKEKMDSQKQLKDEAHEMS